MKFVCDNCQAKYQIGDDKVAGKTVRMKCRKCGYNIKVSATDVIVSAPSGDSPSHVDHSIPIAAQSVPGGSEPVRSPTPAPGLAPPQAPAAAPGSPNWSEEDESTQMMSMPAAAAGMIAPRPTVPGVGGPTGAPRPGAPAPAPRPVPAPPRPIGAAAPGARSITSSGVARSVTPPPTRHPSGTMPRPAGLGDAGKPPRPVVRTTMSGSYIAVRAEPEHEWYVGIGGTPIGPVRLSVIRERAAAHEVDGESLVWREGMSEWKALRNYPELLEVVNEARAAPPPAPAPLLITPTPFAAVAALSAPVAAAPAPTPAPAAPVAAAPVAAAPVAAAPVAAAPVAPAAPVIAVLPEAVPASKQNGKSNGFHVEAAPAAASAAPLAVIGPAVAPDVIAPAAPAAAPVAVVKAPAGGDDLASLEESLIPRRRGGVHPMAYAFVAAAAVFGGVAAWVLLRPQQPQIVFVQAPPTTATTTPSATPDKGSDPAVEVGEITATPGSTARPGTGGPRPKATGTAVAAVGTGAPVDTSGFVNNVPGPTATGAPPSNAGTLSAGEISAVVAQNQAIIKRKCWQPALEAKAPGSPANARINSTLVIGASGAVESASTSGGDSFPGLASCIQSRMKNWHFPPSGSSSTVQVPFVFAGQ